MNILAVMPWYPATASRFFVDAFERAGANIYRVGPCYFSHGNADWQPSDFPKVDTALARACPWQIDHYIDLATQAGCPPDFVFISEETYHNLVMNTTKIPSVLWSADGWPENYERVEHIHPTIAYTNHPFGIKIHPRTELDPRWFFLPGACAPWVHREIGIPRDITFCLHASMYGKRTELTLAIAETGGRTLSGSVNTQRYVKGYNRALCTYHNTNGQEEIKWRFFEAMAMGCCIISGPTRLLGDLGYIANMEYVPILEVPDSDGDIWPRKEDLIRAVKIISDNSSFRREVTSRAKAHTLSSHTYYNRIQTILMDLETMHGFSSSALQASLEKFIENPHYGVK